MVPLKLSVWQRDTLILNRDKIVFIGKVGEESQVMDTIRQSKNNQ